MKTSLNRNLIAALAFALMALPAFAQNYTGIIWTNIADPTGTVLTAGQACFQIVTSTGQAQSVALGGGGSSTMPPICFNVVSGSIGSGKQVANLALTSPTGLCYSVIVQDTAGNTDINYPCVPIMGSSFSMDTYAPTGIYTLPSPGPSSISGNLAVSGTLGVTGAATLTSAAISGNVTVAGNIDTAATPGTVFAANRFAQATIISTATYTISQADCGDILQFGYSGGATVTLPTITTLSTNCFFHVYATTATTLSSGSANIFYPQDTGAEASSYTLAALSDADIVAIQGFGYIVTGVPVVRLGVANTFTAAQTFSGGVNTSAAPGTVYSTNRGWNSASLISSATPSITSADCGRADALIYSGTVTIALPTITTLPANCSLHFGLSPATTLALTSSTANIGSVLTAFTTTFPPIAGPLDVEVDAFQGFGYSVVGTQTWLQEPNTYTAAQTFTAGATLGSTITVPPMESVVTGGIDLAGPVAGGAPTLPVFPGGTFIGDSATGGYSPGCTPVPVYGWCTTGYAWLLAPDLGGFPTVQGDAGDTSVDTLREWILPYIAANPVQDQRMPLMMGSTGGNDALDCPGCTTRFVNTMRTALVLSAVPASHVTFGQSSSVTASGTWTADNFASLGTYNSSGPQPAVSGMAEVSSAASSTLTFPITTTNNNQGVYCGWRVFTTAVAGGASSGAASFAIGGTSIADTWSALLAYGTGHNTLDSVFTQQYIVPSAGTYTVTVTVATAPFSFVYCAVAPQTLYEVGQPGAVFANIGHQLTAYGGASDTVTGNYTTAMNGLVAQLRGDNVSVAVADVWDYVLPTDINHVDGVHPTIAGYKHGRDAFAYGITQLSQHSMLNAGVLRSCGTFTTSSTSQTFTCAQVTPQSKCATDALNASGSSVYITAKAAQSVTVASTIGAQFDLSCSAN